jgi:hypothetical protein
VVDEYGQLHRGEGIRQCIEWSLERAGGKGSSLAVAIEVPHGAIVLEQLRQPALRLAPGAAEAASEHVQMLLPPLRLLSSSARRPLRAFEAFSTNCAPRQPQGLGAASPSKEDLLPISNSLDKWCGVLFVVSGRSPNGSARRCAPGQNRRISARLMVVIIIPIVISIPLMSPIRHLLVVRSDRSRLIGVAMKSCYLSRNPR